MLFILRNHTKEYPAATTGKANRPCSSGKTTINVYDGHSLGTFAEWSDTGKKYPPIMFPRSLELKSFEWFLWFVCIEIDGRVYVGLKCCPF